MEKAPHGTLAREQIQVAQAAGVIALGNVASRVLGLAREMVKSGLFGAGANVSALNAAVRVPTTLYDLLVGGMISSALVPVLSEYVSPARQAELWRLLGLLLALTCAAASALLVVGEVCAREMVWLIAGGLSPAAQDLATELLRLVLPAVVFLNLAGVVSAALYALKRFTLPAFTAAVFNGSVVVLALLLGWRWGVQAMAAGLVVGSVLQLALQLPGLRDMRLRLSCDLHHPALARIGRLYLPILGGLVVDNLLAVVLSYHLASRLGDSAIAWMEYAAQIIQFPLGLVATAVSIAILPTLSRHASAQESGPFQTTLAQGLRLVFTLVIPATIGLFLLANPLVALVFEHGDFAPADTIAVAEALRYHLLGLPFAAVDQVLIFAFYARKDTLTPALVGVGTTVFYALAALGLTGLGLLTLPLLILANSLKWAGHALTMFILTWRRLGGWRGQGWRALSLKIAACSSAMLLATSVTMRLLAPTVGTGLWGEISLVAGSGGAGAAAYGLLAVVMRVQEVRTLYAALVDTWRRLTGRRRHVIMPPPEETEWK